METKCEAFAPRAKISRARLEQQISRKKATAMQFKILENSSRDPFDGFFSQDEEARKKKAAATPAEAPKVYRSGVGKYIPNKPASRYHSFTKLIRCKLSQLIDKFS